MATSRARGGSAVLMLSPYLPYSAPLVEAFAARGLGTVALYTDLPALRHFRSVAPLPSGPSIVASYVADERDLDLVAGVLRDRHDVVAVCPVFETDLLPLSRIAELLGVSSVDPDVIARFRDKAALKEHLRSAPGGPRVNVTCEVSSGADVRAALAEHGSGTARSSTATRPRHAPVSTPTSRRPAVGCSSRSTWAAPSTTSTARSTSAAWPTCSPSTSTCGSTSTDARTSSSATSPCAPTGPSSRWRPTTRAR